MQKLAGVFVLMIFSCHAAHLDPRTRLLALPEGSFIEVRLLDKSRFHGRLDKVEVGGFLITTPTPNHLDLVQHRIVLAILAFFIGPLVLAISGDRQLACL
jgi:hypothetical protein